MRLRSTRSKVLAGSAVAAVVLAVVELVKGNYTIAFVALVLACVAGIRAASSR